MDRNAVKPAVVLKLQDQKFVYDTTIYPEGMTPPASSAHHHGWIPVTTRRSFAGGNCRTSTTAEAASQPGTGEHRSMDTFVQQLINGLNVGAIYALIALGYTMVYGILRLINFAHGDVYMVGAFAGFYIALYAGFAAGASMVTLIVVLLGAMIIAAVVGMIIDDSPTGRFVNTRA